MRFLLIFLVGNHPYHRPSFDFLSHRLLSQGPARKRTDDEESHIRTSSISSTTAPMIPSLLPQKLAPLNDPSANVKVNIAFSQESIPSLRLIRSIYPYH